MVIYSFVGFVEGIVLVATPGPDPRLLAAGRPRVRDGLLDARPGARQPRRHRGLQPHPHQPPGLAVPVLPLRHRRPRRLPHRFRRAPRALAAHARPADGHHARPGLVEARAAGLKLEDLTKGLWRQMVRPRHLRSGVRHQPVPAALLHRRRLRRRLLRDGLRLLRVQGQRAGQLVLDHQRAHARRHRPPLRLAPRAQAVHGRRYGDQPRRRRVSSPSPPPSRPPATTTSPCCSSSSRPVAE